MAIDYPWFKSYDKGVPHTLEPYPAKTFLDGPRKMYEPENCLAPNLCRSFHGPGWQPCRADHH